MEKKPYRIVDTKDHKMLSSESYNFAFRKRDGYFLRWGKTQADDPQVGLPEIADIEISTICSGPDGKPCPACYKSNSPIGDNMSVDTYRKILDKLHYILISVELDNGTVAVFNENDYITTQRGAVKAKDLLYNDEIIQQ